MPRVLFRLSLLLVLGTLLQGCSAIRLGYGQADSLSRWWIDNYVDLSAEQDILVRDRLVRLHAWHRKTQLPDYAALVRQGQKLAAGQPTVEDALAYANGVIRRGRTLADYAAPDIADLLLTLTPEQIERMERRFADKNGDYAREHRLAEGDADQRKARYKRLLDQAENWLGDIADEQKAGLRQRVDAQAAGSQFWFDERQRRQRDWLALVRQVQRERPARDRVIVLLRNYIARFDLPEDPVRLARAQTLRRATAEITVAMLTAATPEQRAHIQQKLGDLLHDFNELARELPGN